MPDFIAAGIWGLVSGSGLLVGAFIADAFHDRLTHRIIGAVTGFGGGILIAIVSVELLGKAFQTGTPAAAIVGLLVGAAVFSGINWWLGTRGAKNRKRCGGCVEQPREAEHKGSGLAIAIGSLLDGIPEALVIGMSMLSGGKIGFGIVAGFFLANIPQGLSSASGMRSAGRSRRYIYSVWVGIPLAIGLAGSIGNLFLNFESSNTTAGILAFAAGAVLAMLTEAMIPEAFEQAPPFIGLITVSGFLGAFLVVRQHL